MRYWVSWTSGYYSDEGCTDPGIQVWMSGSRFRRTHLPQAFPDGEEKDDGHWCAVIDGEETHIAEKLKTYFPDMEMRFIEERPDDYVPGDRFPDFQNRTMLPD